MIYRRLTGIDFEVPSRSPLDDRCVSIYRVVIYWNLLIWAELKSLEGNRIVTRSTVINELYTSNTALAVHPGQATIFRRNLQGQPLKWGASRDQRFYEPAPRPGRLVFGLGRTSSTRLH